MVAGERKVFYSVPRQRWLALLGGVAGGIVGILSSLWALSVNFPVHFGTVETAAYWGMAASGVAIIGALLTFSAPRTAGGIMLVAAIGGVLAISAAYIFTCAFLITTGLLAISTHQDERDYAKYHGQDQSAIPEDQVKV